MSTKGDYPPYAHVFIRGSPNEDINPGNRSDIHRYSLEQKFVYICQCLKEDIGRYTATDKPRYICAIIPQNSPEVCHYYNSIGHNYQSLQ